MEVKKRKEVVRRLLEEKEELIQQIDSLKERGLDSTLSYSTGELSVYDNHPADLGDELFERSKDVALKDNAQVLLREVEKALQKIDNGDYGYCSKCGKPIPGERLEAIPWANECIQCQEKDEAVHSSFRPLEEEILAPPFQRTFLDHDEKGFVGFDGEDALQAVMRYGSSDTPQDISGSRDYKKLFFNSPEHQGIVDPIDAIPVKERSETQ